ncbi:stage VI sporulation protein D [Aureibacillus halotolerans]|uniref:Stage VI sporulation protein D n=1 Tax=Aureibacillus halotolerans TaxID=1508390 RepID=A0A4R6U0P7_9BACI|nr:stage VI sporulation protein D [Aureibacillus halotolerans]TDQ37949.1 stage VI sporulation protein D [Aureibacillus halotolerans]
MAQGSSSLHFSLEESIAFRNEQSFEEFLSISLDPDISIIEQAQYVSIKGALVLSGEYEQREEQIHDTEFTSIRNVDEVTGGENGVLSFQHRFPVDITIPSHRIESLDHVYVTVESFDYDTTSQGNLNLQADVAISGILQEGSRADWQDQEIDDYEEDGEEFGLEDSVASQQREEQLRDEEAARSAVVHYTPTLPGESNEERELKAPARRDEQKSTYEQFEAIDYSETLPSYQREQEEDEQEDVLFHLEEMSTDQDEPRELVRHNRTPAFHFDSQAPSDDSNDDQAAVEKTSSTRNENALYLTKFLQQHEDGERLTRMKICIVQEGDSVEHLAEKYDVQSQQIVRENKLEDETLEEGQLLYIPVSVASK